MFANFANPRNLQTFPAAYIFMSGKVTFYLSTDFGDLRTFPHAQRPELQIGKLIDMRKYPHIQYNVKVCLAIYC